MFRVTFSSVHGLPEQSPRQWFRYTCIFFLLTLCPAAFAAAPADIHITQTKTLSRTADPVIVTGADLKRFTGKRIAGLRLFSFRKGKHAVIPFQIDQRDSGNNFVWDKAFRGGKEKDDQDPEGEKILDGNDLLVFLSKDTGDRNPDVRQSIQAQDILEIEVKDTVRSTESWVYLADFDSNPVDLSDIRYMRFSTLEQTITSPIYEFSYSLKHIAVLKDLRLKGQTVMDRLKIRGEAEIKLGPLKPSLHFNEEDMGGYMEGYIDGPVRTVLRTVNFLRLPMGLRMPKIDCNHFYYPEHSEIPLILSVRYLVHRASLLLTADYREDSFRKAYLDGEKNPILIGQGLDRARRAKIEREGQWMALEGEKGTIISMMELPVEVRKHITVGLYLLDDPDAGNKPEGYPGSEPEAGFRIATRPDFPKGDYIIYGIFLMSPEPYQRGHENKIINLMRHKLTYRVFEK